MKQDDCPRTSAEIEGNPHSLARSLVLWFLLLTLLPLSLVSFVSYQQANNSLILATIDNLKNVAEKDVGFIENWFDYRAMDINVQAASEANIALLKTLRAGWKESGKKLNTYVKSDDWAMRIDASHDDLTNLTQQYDYILDVFLIDGQGNVLFSATNGAGLGSNLFEGLYSASRFSNAVKTSLASGFVQFSDFERYAPSNNDVSGFIAAPLLDALGEKVGVVAIKLSTARVYAFLQNENSVKSREYLVGEQGFLRTPIEDERQVLIEKVDVFRGHGLGAKGKASEYVGVDGEDV
ncbi:MAG: cache domain-containing protein, partial [Pseudomonadales bacterium]|nr:cache domain-containing protein [Pseudomonadales bacterium]